MFPIGIQQIKDRPFFIGYDLSTDEGYDLMKKEFEEIIGFQYLAGIHVNDSKGYTCISYFKSFAPPIFLERFLLI